ncbi:protein NRT1/ PTR FAMILY 2.3-like isoform X2 [Nymphaea colorata]|uniref:protein NRT1/ PTR FAMILY 2.3-like isoform X2 n=1 Tax=Nymphaea colorata TaxID=210225 RepID=UPI00129DA8E6|nr:protein NRT1/ PTR FAMILY 2.3-like isoform X2 [Nymphaea colorata]
MGKEKGEDEQEMASLAEEGSLVPALAIGMPNHQKVGQTSSKKGGGWVTAPFILGSSLASSIACYGATIDLLQFLVLRFNISNIRASQITNIINSVTSLSPVAGAVLCDSYLGCFLTISLFTFISFLGTLMLALAASLPSLAPPSCSHQLGSCQPPTPTQFAFLCLAFSVTTLGTAGTSFTYVTIGADQFDRKEEQESFINKAALIAGGDTHLDGSIAKRWRLCTIQEVEDLKPLIRLFPLWSTGIYLTVATAVQTNLTILQSLVMDRSLGSSFKVPAASFQVFFYASMAISLPLIDRFFYPFSRLMVRRPLTLLHKIGVGHVITIVGLAAMACVEARRLQVIHQRGLAVAGDHLDAVVPISALWLVLPLVILGVGSAFYIPNQVNLYYQEFPASLKNVGTSMSSLAVGIGYYLSTTLVHAVQKATPWLTDDIDRGRVDNVYWLLVALGALNFLYYVLCAKLYELKSSG